MLNIGLQFFAHKKGGGSTKNGRDSNAKRLGPKRADDIAALFTVTAVAASAAPTSIRASTSVSALTILSTPRRAACSVSSVSARIVSRLLFTPLSNCTMKGLERMLGALFFIFSAGGHFSCSRQF